MNRFFRLALIALLLAALGSVIYWQRQHSASQQRLQAWEAHQLDEAIPAAWDQTFSWEQADLTLAEFAQLVAAKSGLTIELDEPSIAAVRSKQIQPGQISIHVPPGDYPLHVLLRMALTADGLCADLRGQKIVITAEASSTTRTRLYAATYPTPQPLPEGLAEEDWQHLISGVVEGHVEAVPGALIVVENAPGHRRVRATIDSLCQLAKPTEQPVEIPGLDEANHRRLFAALAESTRFDFQEVSLVNVVRHLAKINRVPIVIDVRALNNAGVSLDTPLTKTLQGISLQSALRLILSELELTHVLRDGVILITTPEEAESRMQIVAYPVNDLLHESRSAEHKQLTTLIEHAVAPQSWDSIGGVGCIRSVDGVWLIILQTNEVHDQVVDLLGMFRTTLASPPGSVVLPAKRANPARKIHEALERTIELDLSKQSLNDAVSLFRDELQIPIVLNTKKMDEAGVSVSAPVSVPLTSARAGLFLDLVLEPLELVSAIRDEVLLITTPEDAESQLITRLYDTRRLLSSPFDAADLRELITRVVQPNTWDKFGGVGSQFLFRDLLIISHTEDVHRAVEQLLATLDKHLTADTPQGDDRPWIIPVAAPPVQQALEQQLQQLVDVQIENQPLETALQELAQQHQFHLILDRVRIERDDHPLPLPPVSLAASQLTLAATLDRLLAPQALHYALRENVVHVSSTAFAAERDEIRLYRVSDLVPSRWKTVAECEQALVDSAASAPVESTWIGGNTATIAPDWLHLHGPRQMHAWAAEWLASLRTAENTTAREVNQP